MPICPALIFAEKIHALRGLGCVVTEEIFRVKVASDALSQTQIDLISSLIDIYIQADVGVPALRIQETAASRSDLVAGIGKSCSLVMGTQEIAKQLALREDEDTRLFFSVEGFSEWARFLNPFEFKNGGMHPNLLLPLTIRVHGLESGFGSETLWILPCDEIAPVIPKDNSLPNDESVQKLTHVISPESSTHISPRTWVMSWGDFNNDVAVEFLKYGCLVLAACLTHEFKVSSAAIRVTVKGSKSQTIALWQSQNDFPWKSLQTRLIPIVKWVYEERSETRLKLLIDRLSIDINPDECWLAGLHSHLEIAFRQAQDSYGFVILERKDAYFKEMREVMKDMKSQADLYAAKVRDLTASLTRDFLGVLVFFGFSFIEKFDQAKISELLASTELSLLLKVLCFYLLFSCVLQLLMHWRDTQLTYKEGIQWLTVLQNYTSRKESQDQFLSPLAERRCTLTIAMVVVGFSYAFMCLIVWNLPFIVKLLLAQ
jgi:hypothetical protein